MHYYGGVKGYTKVLPKRPLMLVGFEASTYAISV